MIKLIELFGGIGTQAMTLKKRFGDQVELMDLVEWDKKSVDIYNTIHGTNHSTADAQKVRGDNFNILHNGEDVFVMTCSSPCQSLSNAGDRDGMEPGHNKKSSLLWEGMRILKECYELDPENHSRQPHYFILENVVGIHNKKNVDWFDTVLDKIADLGYSVYHFDINGKDLGKAQMRKRTFVVAVLKGCGLKYIPFKPEADENEMSELRVSELKKIFSNTSLDEIESENKAHKIIMDDYGVDPDALKKYPYLVANDLDDGKEFAIIDISFQRQNGVKDPTKCSVYTDRFPTLMCKNDRIKIIDTYHKLYRQITAHEAWQLQGFSDEYFTVAKDKYKGSTEGGTYRSLHKTAGDAILIDALDKVIEQIPTEIPNKDDNFEHNGQKNGSLYKSRFSIYDTAFDSYNKKTGKSLARDKYAVGKELGLSMPGSLWNGIEDDEIFNESEQLSNKMFEEIYKER